MYDDNGAPPDGPAYLPGDVITEDAAAEVMAAGMGQMVTVHEYDDDDMAQLVRVTLPDSEADDYDAQLDHWIERIQGYLGGRSWAHYGAYGAGDSRWMVV
jgi:hypothetical protein